MAYTINETKVATAGRTIDGHREMGEGMRVAMGTLLSEAPGFVAAMITLFWVLASFSRLAL
jgi:hypothetical protein